MNKILYTLALTTALTLVGQVCASEPSASDKRTVTINPFDPVPTLICDVNNDGMVTTADLLLIRLKTGQAPVGANAVYDTNGDGAINVADVRYCQLRLTP